MTTRSHFMEQGRSVFILWEPMDRESLHSIINLSSGDFEVTCNHKTLCDATIRAQIKHIIANKKDL